MKAPYAILVQFVTINTFIIEKFERSHIILRSALVWLLLMNGRLSGFSFR